jgi:hypothetical protein
LKSNLHQKPEIQTIVRIFLASLLLHIPSEFKKHFTFASKIKYMIKAFKHFSALLIMIFPTLLSAQTEVVFDEAPRPFTLGTQNSFQFDLKSLKAKDVEKDWMNYLKIGSKSKAQSLNGEIIILGAVNTNISLYPFNVYSKILETTEGVRMTAWFALNDSTYIANDSTSDKNLAAQKYLRDFAITQIKKVAQVEVDAEKAKLKVLETDLNGIIKQIEQSNKKISESNRTIDRNKDNIRANELEQANKARQIQSQKQTVDNTRQAYGATNKAAQDALKDLEKEKSKLEKEKEKMSKEIDNANVEIRKEERTIEKLNTDKQAKETAITAQKEKVKEAEEKVANIK